MEWVKEKKTREVKPRDFKSNLMDNFEEEQTRSDTANKVGDSHNRFKKWRQGPPITKYFVETLKVDGEVRHLLHGPLVQPAEVYQKKEQLQEERDRKDDVGGFPRFLLVKVEEEIR